MAMRAAAAAKNQVCLMESSRKMMTTTMIPRYFSSDGNGWQNRTTSRKRKIKKIELPTHYLEANYRTMKAVVFYAPNIAHIPQSKVLQEMEPAAGEMRSSC